MRIKVMYAGRFIGELPENKGIVYRVFRIINDEDMDELMILREANKYFKTKISNLHRRIAYLSMDEEEFSFEPYDKCYPVYVVWRE